MEARLEAIVERLRRKGYTAAGVADVLTEIGLGQEVASAAWTDALEAKAAEMRKLPK